jgi:hypothetical protein
VVTGMSPAVIPTTRVPLARATSERAANRVRATAAEPSQHAAPQAARDSITAACLQPLRAGRGRDGGPSIVLPSRDAGHLHRPKQRKWRAKPEPSISRSDLLSRREPLKAQSAQFISDCCAPRSDRVGCRGCRHLAFGFHNPRQAPVGSMMMESQPASITSMTSRMIVAPSDLALAVAASMSSTST